MAAEAFVGRDNALNELLAAARQAAAGAGSVMLVCGEPGIGKTRLVEESVRRSGLRALWAPCWDGEGAPAFWPWTQVLRTALDDPEDEQLLSEIGPGGADLARLVGGDDGSPDDRQASLASRFRLFEAVARLLRACAKRRPCAVVIDDLQWADEPSIRLLRFLSHELRTAPLLIIGTYRDTDIDPGHPLADCLDDLVRAGGLIHLSGLGEHELGLLLSPLTPLALAPAALHRHTGGNPFFAREVIRLLRSEGRLEELSRPSTRAIPAGVRAVISRRLARLPHPAYQLLLVASVIGNEFDLRLLAASAGVDEDAALAGLDEAVNDRLLSPATAIGRYAFSHALVRQTLYETLGVSGRTRLHARVGMALAELLGDRNESRLAELAFHFVQGAPVADTGRGLDYATRAAAQATGLLAYEEAGEWYERALEFLRVNGGEAGRETELLLSLGEARLQGGDSPGARDAYVEAAGLSRSSADPQRLARAALGLGAGLGGFEVGLFDRVQVDLLEEALRALPRSDSPLRAWVLARLSVALSYLESTRRRLDLAEEAVAMARRVGEPGALGYALAAHCDAIAGPGDTERRQAESEEVVSLGLRIGDRQLELLGRRLRIVALLEQGLLIEANREVEAFARTAELLRQPLYRWYPPLWRGMRALAEGRFDDAERECAEATAIGAAAHSDNATMLSAVQTWVRLRHQRRFAEAAEIMITFEQFLVSALAMPTLAVAHFQSGRLAAARTVLATTIERFDELPLDAEWLPGVATLSEVALGLNAKDAMRVLYDKLQPFAHRFGVEGIGAGFYGSMAHYLALLARGLGQAADADRYAAQAETANARAGMTVRPPELAASDGSGPGGGIQEPIHETVFRREGDSWLLAYAGRTARLRDSKGLRDLALLLASPGTPVHVRELTGVTTAASTGEALDREAIAAYRRRLSELEDDLTAAETDADVGRVGSIRAERDFLLAELTGALGLGGRARRPGDPVERARKAVAARIGDSIERISRVHEQLGRHLSLSVRTGAFCVYAPERPIAWRG